jgi:hypothetical protein
MDVLLGGFLPAEEKLSGIRLGRLNGRVQDYIE